MTSLTTSSVFVIICSMMTAQFAAADLSDAVLDFIDTYNGIFDNSDHNREIEADTCNLQTLIIKPVYVPTIQKDPMLYFEESLNSYTFNQTLASIVEYPDSGFIDIYFYHFTDNTPYIFNSFNTEELTSATKKSFKLLDYNCLHEFWKLSTGSYAGKVLDYDTFDESRCQVHIMTATCDSIVYTGPYNSTNKKVTVFKRTGDKYPLLGARAGYTGPCTRNN